MSKASENQQNEVKVCTKCGSKMDKNRKHSYCKDCLSKYQKQHKKKRMEEDLGLYLLQESDSACYERGQSDYKKPPYDGVLYKFNGKHGIEEYVLSEKDLKDAWYAQTDIYEANGRKEAFRPTIDRIDTNGHYEAGNIQILSLAKNVAKAKAKPCTIFIIKNERILEYKECDSIKQSLDYFASTYNTGVPCNTLARRIDDGGFHRVGNYTVIIQTKDGSPKINDKPRYRVVCNYRRSLFNYKTGEEHYLFSVQYQGLSSGIWLTPTV